MKTRVVVNDRMQRGYSYYRTEPSGRHFDRLFRPELTPKQMLQLGVFGGEIHDGLPRGVPGELVCAREAVRDTSRPETELLRRQCFAVARDLASKWLDSAAGSTRLVSVVLPVLHGPPIC